MHSLVAHKHHYSEKCCLQSTLVCCENTKKNIFEKTGAVFIGNVYFCNDLLAQLDRATFLRKVWLRVRIPHRNQLSTAYYKPK